MTAVLLVLALTTALSCGLGWLARRCVGGRSGPVTADKLAPQPPGPEIAELDDADFRTWVGVLPATYDRYVDTGIEDLEIYLADRPARRVGEDPAGSPT